MTHDTWNQFVLAHGPRSGRFLQSWEWGEFQKAVGETVRRESFVQDGDVVGLAQWIDREVPLFGKYSFCPKGPIGAWQNSESSSIFLRIEPQDSDLPVYAQKSIDLNPSHTYITDLSLTDEEQLTAMHSKTRYNIRVAQKHGVDINRSHEHFSSTWELFHQTASRGQFRLHAKRYYEVMLASLQGECRAFLATASHEGKLIAANIMIDFGDTRTYLHGASSNTHRNLMGPYLLHWELLRDAKARGMRFYDWWGVAPPTPSNPSSGRGGISEKDHPWVGISRFKRGFSGVEYASSGTYDLVLQPRRYDLYQLGRSLVRSVRRYV
jgi:peptidoglycan pentaglycine glycine transferase (the first glycine)